MDLARVKAGDMKSATLADFEDPPRELLPEEREIIAGLREISPFAPAYLTAWIYLGVKSKAAQAAGISSATVRTWTKRSDVWRQVEEFYAQEIRDRWNAIAQARGLVGFKEEVYDKEGNLKHTRVRQDPSFLARLMTSIDREGWREDPKGQPVEIVIIQRNE